MRNPDRILLALLAVLALCVGRARADIVSAAYHPGETMDLTRVGAVDWCVYRITDVDAKSFGLGDCKKGGAGIARTIGVRGRVTKVEITKFTGVGWAWTDGATLASHSHRQGDDDGMGVRAWLAKDAALLFTFAPAPDGGPRQAHLIVRCDGRINIVARQGDAQRSVAAIKGKRLGIAVVRYEGDEPLTIALVNPDRRDQVVRGIAAALSGPVDHKGGIPRLPTRQELAARQAEKLGKVDFLKAATDFADCMLTFGRDRYGTVHSPLFAVLLTREAEPRIGPYPLFADPGRVGNYPVYNRFDFNKCLNYPAGLGGEGPHKVTVYGCDIYEDRGLYAMLIDLSRITGEPRYQAEAHKALAWWFQNTLGPADLYPWGEHLGWDFEHECPTYFRGPSKLLYGACYHEIKDTVPFLDVLARLPAARPGERTPLERYALGVWNAHYWDRDRAIYCRHGDYTGQDKRTGSTAGFPAHQGAHLRLWVQTYLATRNAEVKRQMAQILHKVLDVQIARARKFGFIPFTFDPDVKGKKPQKSGQSDRLAHHAAELSVPMCVGDTALARKLAELAKLLLGDEKFKQAQKNMQMYTATGDSGYLQGAYDPARRPAAEVRDLSKADSPKPHAREIIRLLQWHKHTGDAAYLEAARQQARLAYVRFMDDTSPLPKAYETPRKTVAGKPFPGFYFRGAQLMHAFALLGEALRRTAREGT